MVLLSEGRVFDAECPVFWSKQDAFSGKAGKHCRHIKKTGYTSAYEFIANESKIQICGKS